MKFTIQNKVVSNNKIELRGGALENGKPVNFWIEIFEELFKSGIVGFLHEVNKETRGRKDGYRFFIPEFVWIAFIEYQINNNSYFIGTAEIMTSVEIIKRGGEIFFMGWKVQFGYENKLIIVHDNYPITGFGYYEGNLMLTKRREDGKQI